MVTQMAMSRSSTSAWPSSWTAPALASPLSAATPAAELAQCTLPGVVMGTAAYMSPEQVRGIAIDGRADIFSLGVLLFEMATGQSPFQRENFMDSLHAVAFENPPSLLLAGPSARRAPADRLALPAQRPGERYANARLLARDLRELRRNTEAGVLIRTSWRVRLADSWERLTPLAALAVYLALVRCRPPSASPSTFPWPGLGRCSGIFTMVTGLCFSAHS